MIPEVQLRSLARRWNVSLMLLDLDYSLGCFLAGLGRQDLAGRLRFKGGTCLRKCYFPDYRFSEDLDFTAESRLTEANLKAIIEKAMRWVEREIGLDFSVDRRQPDSYLLPPGLFRIGPPRVQIRLHFFSVGQVIQDGGVHLLQGQAAIVRMRESSR